MPMEFAAMAARILQDMSRDLGAMLLLLHPMSFLTALESLGATTLLVCRRLTRKRCICCAGIPVYPELAKQ